MKKICFLFAILIASLTMYGQTQQDDLQKEMELLNQEMQRLMGEFQQLMGESMMLSDTLMHGMQPMVEHFQQLDQLPSDSLTIDYMMGFMQQQFRQLSQQDWSALQRMMEGFAPNLPAPTPEGGTDGKKRKSTDI